MAIPTMEEIEEAEQAPLCPSCGYRMEWQECEEYGCEDGRVSLYDDDPLWYDEDDTEPCQICAGAGGWWRCPNTPEWCKTHPVGENPHSS